MADTLRLQITTPARQLVDAAVTRAEIPGKDGYLGILPGHAPLLSELGAGVLTYSSSSDSQESSLVVIGGFLEVLNDEVRVLAERAEYPNEINAEKARAELSDAQAEVSKQDPNADTEAALRRLRAAQARVEAVETSQH